MPLDKAITASILAVPAPELRRRLATQVLLSGGGARVRGLVDEVEERLVNYLTTKDTRVEIVNVLANVKDVDPAHLAWRGATVVSWAESARDQWLSREEWASLGVRALRERAAWNWLGSW
jgi:actin-related protein 8